MNNIYNETIQIGKIHSGFSIVFQLIQIIIVVIIIFLLYMYYKRNFRDGFIDTTATIINSECNYYRPDKSPGKYSCNLHVSYFVNGKKYEGNIVNDTHYQHKSGSKITISYDNTDPNIIKIIRDYSMISIFVGFIILIMLGSCVRSIYDLYMTKRYGVFSSIYGTGAAFRHGSHAAL